MRVIHSVVIREKPPSKRPCIQSKFSDRQVWENSVDPDQTAPSTLFAMTECASSIGSTSAWHASGPEFDPHLRHILSYRLGHENIFSLFRRFKKSSCQLPAKECALSTGKLPRRLAQEQCG